MMAEQLPIFPPDAPDAGTSARRRAVRNLLRDGRWHDTTEVNAVDVGGSEGTRRLRELRAAGYTVEKRRKPGSSQYQYRLKLGGSP